jgi:hypothetical protein
MRASPLGIFGAGDPAAAADWARADSRLTHPHQVCQDACAVFVVAIATAIAEGGSPQDCYEAALGEAERSSVIPAVSKTLAEAAKQPPEDYQKNQGWVQIALQNAFYQLLHAPNLEQGVVQTVMHGGDTDTNAAIAGSLLGAVYGRDAIPPQWLRSVLSCRPLPNSGSSHARPIEFWPVDALRLAENLLLTGLKSRPSGGSDGQPKLTYSDESARTDSEILVVEAELVVKTGRAFLRSLDRHGIRTNDETWQAFSPFLDALYGAGMVMSDFDGMLFYQGPGRLIFDRQVAADVASHSNLLAVRMFLHALARGHKAAEMSEGFPCFDKAYESGGLSALIDRLDDLCKTSKLNGHCSIETA